uniref:Uncharacterized protein n=1 Tax=Arundo donax TaxID=35708 RepID=A0A0A9DBW4_ARUDO
MDAAVGFRRPGREGLHRRGVRHVQLPAIHAGGPLHADPLRRFLSPRGVAGGEHDVEAVERELVGGGDSESYHRWWGS